MKKKVLIIDDDLNVCRQIKYSLQNDTTEVYYVLSVRDGLKSFMEQSYCLVIMDIVLSETDGHELLTLMRQAKPTPILVLSSKPGNEHKLKAYHAGAHAYLEKPYELEECLAQAEALMQLYVGLVDKEKRCYTLAFGKDLIIDPVRRTATLKGEPLDLTKKEFELLFTLASHAGQVLSREQLYMVTIIDVCRKKIAGCLACEYCHTKGNGQCIQKDDMQEIYPVLQEADMIVLASPIYYHSFTGQLQCAINRIYALDKPANLKKAALIMSSGSDHVYCGAIYEYQNSFLNYLKLEDMGIFSAHGKENKSEEKLEELREFGRKLK